MNTRQTQHLTVDEAANEARNAAMSAAVTDALRAACALLTARGVFAEVTVTPVNGRTACRDNF
jgi:hypothetical protein